MSQSSNPYGQQNPNNMPRREPPKAPETIEYICGDCGQKTAMKTTESIRCKECGHRVMYKPRTHRSSIRSKIVPDIKPIHGQMGRPYPPVPF